MAANEAQAEFLAFSSPGTPTKGIEGVTIASAAGLIAGVTHYLHTISGTAAITLIPIPYDGFAGTIAVRPTGAFTGATGGVATATNKPVGLNFTAVTGKILFLTYFPSTGLWYPSYVA